MVGLLLYANITSYIRACCNRWRLFVELLFQSRESGQIPLLVGRFVVVQAARNKIIIFSIRYHFYR